MKVLLFFLLQFSLMAKDSVVIGSKTFTEGYILAEIAAQIIEDAGEVSVTRRFGLGGTGITFQAMESGDIDLYPEYTGTLSEVILKSRSQNLDELSALMGERYDLELTPSLGFNNTYALAMPLKRSLELSLKSISDLRERRELKTVFTHEFIKRRDGLKALEAHYGFQFKNPLSMEHALAFEALRTKRVDVIEVYSTDAKIKKFNLRTLEDDKGFFPEYVATLVLKREFRKKYPRSYAALKEKLFNRISEEKMVELNSLVELDGQSIKRAAEFFLGKTPSEASGIPLRTISKLSLEHIKLVLVSLFYSILFGIPLGIVASRSRFLAQVTLVGSGLLQTIPSLALLCFLIPSFGIGTQPAYIALFLYGLLPIVRGTYTGINQIAKSLQESSDLMGMTTLERLRIVELPLASVSILNGVKTSAVINVGTATLAAFIGAGGLGSLIVTGLSLNDNSIILAGAIPSALLACLIHLIFEIVDKMVIPKGLRS